MNNLNIDLSRLKPFEQMELFFYITSHKITAHFQFKFQTHECFERFLNFFHDREPDIWGEKLSWGNNKFFLMTENLLNEAIKIIAEIKANPEERENQKVMDKLLECFKAMSINRYICYTSLIASNLEVTKEWIDYLSYQASCLDNGKTLKEATAAYDMKYSLLLHTYDLISLGKEEYSEGSTASVRTCRFCKKDKPKTDFNHLAHAIPDSVGNKLLFCNEECNNCNCKFGSGIESDFNNMLHFNRSFFSIKNKKKKKAVCIGTNFAIDKAGNLWVDQITEEDRRLGKKRLEWRGTFSLQSIYRSLAKFVVNLIPAKHLGELDETISWINGSIFTYALPNIYFGISNEFLTQPHIDIFIKREKEANTPYCLALLRCIDIAYFFILPLVKSDGVKFASPDAIKKFDSMLQHVFHNIQWYVEDYSLTEPRFGWRWQSIDNMQVTNLEEKIKEIDHSQSRNRNWVNFPVFDKSNVKYIGRIIYSYTEHLKYAEIHASEYHLSNVQHDFKLFFFENGKIEARLILNVTTNTSRPIFDLKIKFEYRLKETKKSIKYDDNSLAIDINLAHYILKSVLWNTQAFLVCEHQQQVKLTEYMNTFINSYLYHTSIYWICKNNQIRKVKSTDIWSIKYLHL